MGFRSREHLGPGDGVLGTPVPSTGPQGTGESCGEMGLEVGSHPKKLK